MRDKTGNRSSESFPENYYTARESECENPNLAALVSMYIFGSPIRRIPFDLYSCFDASMWPSSRRIGGPSTRWAEKLLLVIAAAEPNTFARRLIDQKYSRAASRHRRTEPLSRAAAMTNGSGRLFFGPCEMTKSILYTRRSFEAQMCPCRPNDDDLGEEQRSWSPSIGFQCLYESYFQDDMKFWFLIPRLITSYARRRDAAISQFLNGSWRLAVALMVMAAELDVTLNVCAFEELMTSVNPLDEGLWSIKMRSNCNVVKGYPNKMVDWQGPTFLLNPTTLPLRILRTMIIACCGTLCFVEHLHELVSRSRVLTVLFPTLEGDHSTSHEYPEKFLPNARAIARLQPERWGNITRDRIRRCVDRISRRDWNSIYLPATNTVKRRISLFTRDEQREINVFRGMKGLPDLGVMIALQLGLPRPEPVDPSSEVRSAEPTEMTLGRHGLSPVAAAAPAKKKSTAGQENTTEPPRARKKKKQPSDGRSSSREELNLNLPMADSPDNASPPAPLQLTRKLKKTNEQGVAHLEAPPVATLGASAIPNFAEGSALPTPGTSTGGVPVLKKVLKVVFPDRVSFEYDGPTPLIYLPHKCAELVSPIRGGPRSLPPVADLIFKDEYIDAARTKLLSDGSMNFVIEKYDAALKEALANSEKLKEKSAAKGRFFRRKTAEWTAAYKEMVAKRERAIARRKIHQERANAAEADLRVAHSTISALEMKMGRLEEKIRV
ncbi:hypothetical protein N665_3124s0001 [Sinapis alba]|nr:hypothetical protein N665_3124s0001 [Sinapis alba]